MKKVSAMIATITMLTFLFLIKLFNLGHLIGAPQFVTQHVLKLVMLVKNLAVSYMRLILLVVGVEPTSRIIRLSQG